MIESIKHAASSIMGESGWVFVCGVVLTSLVIILLSYLLAKFAEKRMYHGH